MKRIFLGSLSAAALTLGTQAAFAQSDTGSASGSEDMTNVTCEEFLGLSGEEQEMYATALTTADMQSSGGDSGSMSSASGDASSMSDTSDAGSSDAMDTGSDTSAESGMSGESGMATEEGMASGDDGSMAAGETGGGSMEGGSAMQQSPTVVALVTICENSSDAGGSDMESGTAN